MKTVQEILAEIDRCIAIMQKRYEQFIAENSPVGALSDIMATIVVYESIRDFILTPSVGKEVQEKLDTFHDDFLIAMFSGGGYCRIPKITSQDTYLQNYDRIFKK